MCQDRLKDEGLSEWERHLVRYIMSEDDLPSSEIRVIDLARNSDEHPRSKLSRTYAVMALKHLARGEITSAKKFLQDCTDVGFVLQSVWAYAYLARLNDPESSWPIVPATSPNDA